MKLRLAFAVLSLLFVATSVWLSVRVSRQRDRIASLEARLNSQPAPAAPQAPPSVHEESPAGSPPQTKLSPVPPRTTAGSAICPDSEALDTRLRETAASLSRAQSRISDLESQMEDLTKDRGRIAAHESQLQTQMSDLNQTIEAMHAERPQLTKRIKDAESEAERLRQQAQTTIQKNTQFGQLTSDLKEIARRQQVYTTDILRRYRELTDLFRSLPGMVEVRGNGPELARIQSAISMADEDLRQLNDLNTRLGRLQNQITTAIASR